MSDSEPNVSTKWQSCLQTKVVCSLDETPCESPIENDFKYAIQKHLSDAATLKEQVSIATAIGGFRVDFVVQIFERLVGFECDGKEFHDLSKDYIRDKKIIEEKHLDVIYRLRGTDIFNHLPECFKIIGAFEPEIFSTRGHMCIQTLCDRTLKNEYETGEWMVWKNIEQFSDDSEESIPPKRVVVTFTGNPAQPFFIKNCLERPE